jgi:hypothetical protein
MRKRKACMAGLAFVCMGGVVLIVESAAEPARVRDVAFDELAVRAVRRLDFTVAERRAALLEIRRREWDQHGEYRCGTRVLSSVLAVMRDEKEDPELRAMAVRMLATVRHKLIFPVLIDIVEAEQPAVHSAANRQLRLLTGRSIALPEDATAEQREKARKAWRDWWDEQQKGSHPREDFEPDWNAAGRPPKPTRNEGKSAR